MHRFWSDPSRRPDHLNKACVEVQGIDPVATRDFLLSVLWRAHVARGHAFSAVDLGPHSDRILAILRNGSENLTRDPYAVFGYVLREPQTTDVADRLVLTPVKTRTAGQWNYVMAFLGYAWQVFVSREAPPLPDSCRLKQTGSIVMPVIDRDELAPIGVLLKARAE